MGAVLHMEGQTNALESNPLRARKIIIYDQIGVFAGGSFNSQGGSFTTACNCEFDGGGQNGLAFGFLFERLTKSRLRWGVSAGFEQRGVQAKYQEIEGVVQRAPSTNKEYTVPITFRHTGAVTLSYFTLHPYLKYDFFDFIFIRAGVQGAYIATTNIKHTKELLTQSVTFPNGEQASVSLPNSTSNSVVVQDGPLPAVNNLQLGLSMSTGLDIKLTKKLYMSPIIQFVYPITTITSKDNGFTVRAFQILLEARLII